MNKRSSIYALNIIIFMPILKRRSITLQQSEMIFLTRAVNKNLKVEKKELILKASLETFSRVGFARATMRKIAQTADVAVGTIYIYFKNKDEILQELLSRQGEEHESTFEKMSELKFEKAIKFFYEERFAAMAKLHNISNLFMFEASQNPKLRNAIYKKVFERINEYMKNYLVAMAEKKKVRRIKDPEAISIVLLSIINSVVNFKEVLFSKQMKSITYERIIDSIADMALNGLAFK